MGSVTQEAEACPLDCPVCNKRFSRPIRLSCQHCFCHDCVTVKKCPVCKKPIDSLDFKEDVILNFLMESTKEHAETCANCDMTVYPMFYCKTCKEPLCVDCKSNTHQAKIFSNHNIVNLEEVGRDRGRINCVEHNEPFILFCLDQRKLMCAKCFNGSSVENRHNFVNVDGAHKTCWAKLNTKVAKLKSFQDDLKEHIEVRTRVLSELDGNYAEASAEIEKKSDEFVAKIIEVRNELLSRLKKEKQFRIDELQIQINSMNNLVNPIELDLLSASICSTASEIDFLHCYGELVKSIDTILSTNLERITFSSEVVTDFSEEFIKSIEKAFGWGIGMTPPPIAPKSVNQTVATIYPVIKSASASDKSRSTSPLGSYANYKWKTSVSISSDGSHYRNLSVRVPQIGSDVMGLFGDIFKKIDAPLREMSVELTELSRDLIELQRDITRRRCVVKRDYMDKLIERGFTLEKKVGNHKIMMEDMQPVLGNDWQDQMDRIRRQQRMFKDKMKDLHYIQDYVIQARQTATTLKPFAIYMASVIGISDSRRCDAIELAPMEKICLEICNLEPDSQKRIEAIEKEEEAQRQARETARVEEQQTVIKAKQGLKTTKDRRRQSSFSSTVIESSRDRNSMGTPSTRSSKRRQKLNLDNICCDDSGSIISGGGRSISPRDLLMSPTSTSDGSVRSSPITSPIDELLEKSLSNNTSTGLVETCKANELVETVVNDDNSLVEFTSDKLPKKLGTPPLISPVSVSASTSVQTVLPVSPIVNVPISVIPPPPPPPPLNFVAPIRNSSIDEPISPTANQPKIKKQIIPSTIDSPKYETVLAREQLLVQIKERFRKNSESQEDK